EAIEQHLKAIRQSQGAGLDLRRIEHLLVDIRDSNRRIHEQWLGQPSGPGPATGGANAWPLADRIIVRLASQGYERVEILTPRERWESIDSGDGEVLVEARRSGAVYKGRVQIQGGLVGEIHLKPAHTLFP
ncbi:MAG TPA: hypothetical protein PLJ12_15560, partial [Planctomycetota bacterium]|nr:hypothetical protein [Planctomycetota bacterium]